MELCDHLASAITSSQISSLIHLMGSPCCRLCSALCLESPSKLLLPASLPSSIQAWMPTCGSTGGRVHSSRQGGPMACALLLYQEDTGCLHTSAVDRSFLRLREPESCVLLTPLQRATWRTPRPRSDPWGPVSARVPSSPAPLKWSSRPFCRCGSQLQSLSRGCAKARAPFQGPTLSPSGHPCPGPAACDGGTAQSLLSEAICSKGLGLTTA